MLAIVAYNVACAVLLAFPVLIWVTIAREHFAR
jgi:hypothetical protein